MSGVGWINNTNVGRCVRLFALFSAEDRVVKVGQNVQIGKGIKLVA